MLTLTTSEAAMRLGAALVLGALVGLERERKHRPAGFRTLILVSMGSALFMLVGTEMVAGIPGTVGGPDGRAEMSRVLQGLLGGIGFLGAGAVIQSKKAVRGMTTAAAVWVTAGIGAACGVGLYTLAALAVLGALFTLVVLEFFENRYFPDTEDDELWNRPKRKDRNGDAGADGRNGASHGDGASVHREGDAGPEHSDSYGSSRFRSE